MTVSIRKVGKRWHIRFRKGHGKNRREVIKSLPGRTSEAEVRKQAAWFEMEWYAQRYDPFDDKAKSNAPILADALADYINENLLSGNWSEDYTYKVTKNVFKRMFSGHGAVQLGAHTNQALFQSKFDASTGNARTRKGNAGRLNSFLKWAHDNEYLPNRYKVEISKHEQITLRNTEKVKYMTWEQLRDVCSAHRWLMGQNKAIYNTHSEYDPDFYSDMWWFYFYSLLRAEELAKLRAGDLLTGGRLRVQGKGRRTDTIYLSPPALTIAEKYAWGKNSEDPLFTTHTNRSRKHFGSAVELAMGKLFTEQHGRKGFHQLRHSGIVHYLSLGKPIQFVSKLARHSTINITDEVYGDIVGQAMTAAFEDVQHRPVIKERFAKMN